VHHFYVHVGGNKDTDAKRQSEKIIINLKMPQSIIRFLIILKVVLTRPNDNWRVLIDYSCSIILTSTKYIQLVEEKAAHKEAIQ
jgi:hypothetical protein